MKKTILTIATILLAFVSAFSQSVTDTRHIKTTALQVYENYKVVMSGLYSRSAYTEDNFIALFDSKALIYNDILPDNNPQQLSSKNYFAKFKANVNRIYPTFSDFKMGEPVSVGSKWQIKCNFVRSARFRTQNEMNYPEWSFNYAITIEMDKRYNQTNKVYENAKIVNVEVNNPLKNFFVIENKENIPLTSKSGKPVNDWDAEYQSRIFPEKEWKIKDIEVAESNNNKNFFEYSKSKFSKNQADAHFYQLDVQRFPKNIIGIGVNFSPITSVNNISDANLKDKFDDPKSNAFFLSFFYGKQIARKEKSTLFFDFGLDFNKYSHEYNSNKSISQLNNPKIDSLNEKINVISVSIPLSIEYLYQLTQQTKKPIFLSFELGVFAEYALSASSKYNLTNAVYNDITYNINGQKRLEKSLGAGILGGIGLWFALNDNNLLKFNVSYKQSFSSLVGYQENDVISENKDSYHSLLQSTKQGMQNIGIGISWVKTIGRK
jgi:hypothetical protein